MKPKRYARQDGMAQPRMLKDFAYVNGEWRRARSGCTISICNPSDG